MDTSCCDFFKALADPTRVRIMMMLRGKELCVSDICKEFSMKQPSISHHLSILKGVKIVTDRKEGKEVYYKLNECCIDECCTRFINSIKIK